MDFEEAIEKEKREYIFTEGKQSKSKHTPLQAIAEALRDYVNSSDVGKRLEHVESLTFSISLHRTGENEFTFGHPCLSVCENGCEEKHG